MNRDRMIARLEAEAFDVVVIGGGATGLGVAVDAATRPYRTALLEACAARMHRHARARFRC